MAASLIIGIITGAVYGLLALGIVLVYKGSRVLNFAQGEIGTFALFIAWTLIEKRDFPWIVGALAAIVAAVVIGFAFDVLVVQRMREESRVAVAVATVGLFLLLLALELIIWKEPQAFLRPPIDAAPIEIFDFFVSPTQILAVVTVVALGLGLAAFLRYTDFGLGVLAAAQDPQAVRLVGIPLARVSAFTWAAAGGVAAIGALLIAPILGGFAPGLMTELFVRALAAALVGGLANLQGAFVGGVAIGVIEAFADRGFAGSTFPGIEYVTVLAVILLVLLFRPAGILSRRAA